jgi:hypothetical protein
MESGGMIDHLSLGVSDLARSGMFYDAVLAPLGYERLFSNERAIGYPVHAVRGLETLVPVPSQWLQSSSSDSL